MEKIYQTPVPSIDNQEKPINYRNRLGWIFYIHVLVVILLWTFLPRVIETFFPVVLFSAMPSPPEFFESGGVIIFTGFLCLFYLVLFLYWITTLHNALSKLKKGGFKRNMKLIILGIFGLVPILGFLVGYLAAYKELKGTNYWIKKGRMGLAQILFFIVFLITLIIIIPALENKYNDNGLTCPPGTTYSESLKTCL